MGEFLPRGVIPAALLPFTDDWEIDEAAFRAHLRDLRAVDGISAVTINAHATEVASCSAAEQARVLRIARDEIDLPLVHGIYADGSLEAARIAERAQRGGADALLVFPPGPFTMGHTTAMALAHVRQIEAASDLPLILFEYPLASRQGYTLQTLTALCDAVPKVCAIKDWCNDAKLHEQHVRVLQGRTRRVSVLSTHSAWLFSSLVLGCDGVLSGAGSVIAALQVALFQAVQQDDLAVARQVAARIYPLTQAFYGDPFVDMHNRMKQALVLLGRLPRAVVRPPLVELDDTEIAGLRAALTAAGLLDQGSGRRAA